MILTFYQSAYALALSYENSQKANLATSEACGNRHCFCCPDVFDGTHACEWESEAALVRIALGQSPIPNSGGRVAQHVVSR